MTNPLPGRILKERKRKANKSLAQFEKVLANYIGRCLFVTDDNGAYCDKPVSNNCHTVSKSLVLDGLKDDKTQKVLQLQWNVSQRRRLVFSNNSLEEYIRNLKDLATFDLSEKTTREACVGRFACESHDNEFQPIDVAEPNFDDPEFRFLAAYRSVLFQVDLGRKGREFHQEASWMMRNSGRDLYIRWLKIREELESMLREAESTMAFLGKQWYAKKTSGIFDPDIVSAQVLEFRSRLRLAGCGSYKTTYVTIFPAQGDCHKMGVLYLTKDSDLAGEALERLAGVARASEESDDYGVIVTAELMKNGSGTFAVSPRSYEELDEPDRSTIQNLVKEQSQYDEFVKAIDRQSPRINRLRK